MPNDTIESRGRMTAKCSQLVARIKQDPQTYLMDDEKELLDLIVKVLKLHPGVPAVEWPPIDRSTCEAGTRTPDWRP